MPRNSSGTMSAANGPYITNTVINPTLINARLADIESELSDSKSRSGKGDYTAPARGADGSVSAPTFSFTNDTGSGLFRSAASDLRMAIAGTAMFKWLASSLVSLFPHTFTGSATEAPVILTPQTAPSAPTNGGIWTTTASVFARINGVTQTLVPTTDTRVAKAWALLTLGGAGAVTVTAGSNVTSASYSTSVLTVTFTAALSSANFMVLAMEDNILITCGISTTSRSTTAFNLTQYNFTTGAAANWPSSGTVNVMVFGA